MKAGAVLPIGAWVGHHEGVTTERGRPHPARLAEAIREACADRGWLQEDLIHHSGLGRSTIQRLWSGRTEVKPTRRTRTELERILEWEAGTVEVLWAGGERPQPPSPTDAQLADEIRSLRALAAELLTRAEALEARADGGAVSTRKGA
jgi:transcriptional regulator with XRE-family HTH domain